MSFINTNNLRNKKTIKQCLMLCVVAYVTFTTLFVEMNDGDDFFSLASGVVSSRRSLQDKVQTVDVNADHGTEISTTATDVVVIITGKKKTFPMWRDRLNSISKSIDRGSISLLFGSTDEMIPQDACDNDLDLDLPCQTAFIPGTKWTEGHNILADEAMQKEVRMNKKYDYWLFLDDDVEADCSEGGWATEDSLGEGSSCWERIFNFITRAQVPENTSTIGLPLRKGQSSSVRLVIPATESMFAAFKRDSITHLLRSWNRSGYYLKFKILRNQSK